jgi:hypothetical protein
MMRLGFQFLVATLVFINSSWATSDPFVGRWMLNLSKSHTVDEMHVEVAGTNRYTLTFSGAEPETILADGSDQPGALGTTFSVTIAADRTWKVARKAGGRMLLSAVWNLSADGQTLTDAFTSYDPKGSPSTVKYLYKRTAGTGGIVGGWENTTQETNAFELQIEPWKDVGLSFLNSAHGTNRSLKFDGAEYPVTASGAATGHVSSGRRVDARTLEVTDKLNSTVVQTQQITLSDDAKTLTLTMHVLGQNRPNVLVFERV